MTPLGITIMVFIILKATDTVSWSWWVALIPLWVAIVLGVIKALIKRKDPEHILEEAIRDSLKIGVINDAGR